MKALVEDQARFIEAGDKILHRGRDALVEHPHRWLEVQRTAQAALLLLGSRVDAACVVSPHRPQRLGRGARLRGESWGVERGHGTHAVRLRTRALLELRDQIPAMMPQQLAHTAVHAHEVTQPDEAR